MVRPCCICGIRKNSEASAKGIRFFKFPSVKSESHSNWIKTIRHHSTKISRQFTPRKNSIVCSNHFEESCFNRSYSRKLQLKQGSMPTIFNFDDLSKQVISTSCDEARKLEGEKEVDTEGITSSSAIQDYASDGSSSLSPPVLHPLQDINSDFEETIEDPPDLDLYHINHDYDESTGLTSFADMDMIKMDHIGSVADILGPDPYVQDESIVMDERPDSSTGEERDDVDGQTILSFTSAEEMHDFAHRETGSRLTKTNDFRQIKGWRNKFHQLTPSLSPSPCSSPVPIPARWAVSASENSSSPLPTQFFHPCEIPSTSFEDENAETNPESCTSHGSPHAKVQRFTSPVEEEAIMLSEEEAEEETANSSLETTLALQVVGHSEETDKVIKETAGSDESTEAVPDLGIDGSMSYDYAKFAASAIYFPFGEKHRKTTKKAEKSPVASKKVSPRQKKINRAQILPSVEIDEVLNVVIDEVPNAVVDEIPNMDIVDVPNMDIDEVPSVGITGIDESMENVQQEEYVEVYDVPGNSVLPKVDCGHLFCRLGCICGTLIKSKNRPKISMEHCGLPECMLQCVCGYQKGKPSSRKCFASLLKGNESYYSKINWSSERQRRERRVPERFSEFHLGNESSSSISNRSSDEFKRVESKSKNSHHRAGNSHASHPSSPLKNASPPQQHSVSPKNVVCDSLPCPPASRKWEPFRVKVCADEIKLLRWDSFVSLSKVYIAPDHDIFCMEHKMYGCPCIETDRRIIRIEPKYVPIPLIDTTKNANNKSPTSSAKKVKTVTTSPAGKNVAKKHTNPNMRFVAKPKVTETKATPAPQVPKASSLSKMRKILSDERFQLQKLMTDEKMRAFDEEVDLTVRQGQTVQLVAWIRFHRIYHAERIHIRFLSRRAGPVILVMRPNEIVAADITCDIQNMKGNKNSPEIVKELLDPCISPEETSRYAFLLCDGVKWELVGCLSLKATNDAPTSTVPPTSLDSTASSSTSHSRIFTKEVPPVIFDEKNDQQKRIATQMKYLNELAVPSSIERSSALELKRMMLEQRLSVINSKLTLPQPKQSASSKLMKQRSRASTALSPVLRPTTPVEKPIIVEELLPSSVQVEAEPSIQAPRPQTARRTGKRIPDLTYLIPDQCILPDDPVDFPVISLTDESSEEKSKKNIQSGQNLAVIQVEKEPNRTLYPAAEKLAMFSRLIQNSQNDSISGGNYSNFKDSSEKCTVKCLPSKPVRFSPSLPVAVPLPIPLNAPRSTLPIKTTSEVTFLKLQPIGSALPSGILGQNAVRRIRILTPQSSVNGGGGNSFLPVLTSRNGLQPNAIQQQRMHWSSKGVKLPVISKFTPTTSKPDSLVTVLPIPTTAGVGENVSTLPQSCAVDASSVVQLIGPVSNQNGKTPLVTSALPTEDWSAQLLRVAEQEKKRKHFEKSIFPSVVNSGPSKEAELSISCVFPKISTAEVITVKSPPGNPSRRLKIILEAMVGERQDLCPSRASMILPLHKVDDQWCIVAIDHVPDSGFKVPGVTVFIPRDMLWRAASTAMERKARVSLPLHFKLNNDSSSSALKADFEVYGTHQLPRHVFLGPFPFNYLENCTDGPTLNKNVCMFLIKLTKSIPVSDCINEVKQIKSTEQTAVPILKKSAVKSHEPVSESSSTIVNEVSVIPNLVSSSKATSGVYPTVKGVGTGVLENILLNQTNANDSESDVIEIVDEKVNSNSESVQLPILHNSAESRSVKRKKTPIRMFVARTPGLPPANIRVFSENLVVVDHPFLCGEKKTFTSFENAKTWLQMLAIRNCKDKGLNRIDNSGSETSKSSNSPEDSLLNSEATEDEEIDVGSGIQRESQEHEETETIDSASTTSRSPKRIRRLTEKARILAATAKSSRNSSSTASKSKRSHQKPPPSPRVPSRKNSIQRMLHIQKEQERRGLLGKLIRDLDSLCAPGSGIRAKIVVLKNATTTVKKLEQKGKEMENLYQSLKLKRTALLTQREQIFNKLPPNAYNIFNCLMESVPLPSRHLTITASERFKRNRPQVPDQQSRNRVAVVIPNNALLSEFVDRDVAKGYVLTGVEL